jgi:hypothetical protein
VRTTPEQRSVEAEQAAYSGIRPTEIAKQLSCSLTQVHGLIKDGTLAAVNISRGSKLPRWVVSRESYAKFLRDRAA